MFGLWVSGHVHMYRVQLLGQGQIADTRPAGRVCGLQISDPQTETERVCLLCSRVD